MTMNAFLSNLIWVSIQGGIVILAVTALRLVLKQAPKRTICLLWLLAGLRLLLPFQIESSFSLQPEYRNPQQQGWSWSRDELSVPIFEGNGAWGQILSAEEEVLVEKPLGTTDWGEILDDEGNILVEKPLTPNDRPSGLESPEWDWNALLPYLWLLGVAVMTASSLAAYLRLKKRVSRAVILEEGVWVTANIDTAFVLGFFKPRIYLPVWLAETDREFVLDHERSHIARHDQWWKLIGYVALTLHWFNPLVWLGYILLCRDLEMACDENVVKSMNLARRKAYSAALVSCSAVHRSIAACPVAFGEVRVKERVKNVLNFRKPGFWITLAAGAAAIFVAVFLLTSPGEKQEEILRAGYTGPGGEYTYYNTDERALRWEEDVLYVAEKLLTGHPYVTDGNFHIRTGMEWENAEYSNALFDPALRADVIEQVDKLIPRLADLKDAEILFEMQKIMASLKDPATELYMRGLSPERLPLKLEAIYEAGDVSLYAFMVPKENENLLYGKLTAMNGVPIQEVMEKLEVYVSGENKDWSILEITSPYVDTYLYQKTALQVIGLVGWEEDTIELTFETEQGTENAVFSFLTDEESDAVEFTGQLRVSTKKIPYRGMLDEYYWYDVLEEENALYMHIYKLWQDPDEGILFDSFLTEATSHLQKAEEPMRLIIDLRFAGNGIEFLDVIKSFAGRVNRCGNDGVYILVDSTTHSTAVWMAYYLSQNIEGARLVGSATGTGVNILGGSNRDSTPNSGTAFWVQPRYFQADPQAGTALMPDIPVYQTLEDYKNGLDTVYETALHREFTWVSLGTVTVPAENPAPEIDLQVTVDITERSKDATVRMIGGNRILIQSCVDALKNLSSRESVHLTAEATFEGVPGETGSFQEYWQSGEDWMRIGEQYFVDEEKNYTVGNLCLGDTQYRFGHADTYGTGPRRWKTPTEEQLWHRYWLLDFDLSEARILSLEKWDTEEGMAVKMELGRNTDTGVYGIHYRRFHTYYLDAEGKLLRLEEEAVYSPVTPKAVEEHKTLRVDIQIQPTDAGTIDAKLAEARAEAKALTICQ